MTIGSLCTGYGGLDMAAHAVYGGTLAWVSDIEPGPCTLLAARYPDVPNLGDLTIVDWSRIEPVDVLTAGYPCQPFSHAGQRKGTDDERHIWPHISDAIGVLRPGRVVLENVAGHLSLGGPAVIAGLTGLGYDARWLVVRASDVGACHRRARLFIVARHAERARANTRPTPSRPRGATGEPSRGTAPNADAGRRNGRRQSDPTAARAGQQGRLRRVTRTSEDAAPDAGGERRSQDTGSSPRGEGAERCGRDDHVARCDGTPIRGDRAMGEQVVADAACERRPRQVEPRPVMVDDGLQPAFVGEGTVWGVYEPAIRRHEQALGRLAPAPVDAKNRLSPRFVEWMQMLPEGHVTDIMTSRTAALKLLGNGVVPAQAEHALRLLEAA